MHQHTHTHSHTKTYYLQAGHSPAGQAPSVDTNPPCGQSPPAAVSETSVHLSDTLTAAQPAIQISANVETHQPWQSMCSIHCNKVNNVETKS